MNTLHTLVSILFELYIMALILRLWLQWSRADFYNPMSQTVVKVTQPIVAPLRRFIPAIGRIDTATLLLAYIFSVAKVFAIINISSDQPLQWDMIFLTWGAFSLLKAFGSTLFWMLLIRAIMSWISQGRNPIEYVIIQLTEPFLAPIRRILPSLGGLDLSVLVLFIALQIANSLMLDIVGGPWAAF